ncbi:hypothetical protein Tco_0060577 [Tanacetum coccineum]
MVYIKLLEPGNAKLIYFLDKVDTEEETIDKTHFSIKNRTGMKSMASSVTFNLKPIKDSDYAADSNLDKKSQQDLSQFLSPDTSQDPRVNLEGTGGSQRDHVQIPHDSPLLGGHISDRAEGSLNLDELLVLCTNLSNRGLRHLEETFQGCSGLAEIPYKIDKTRNSRC